MKTVFTMKPTRSGDFQVAAGGSQLVAATWKSPFLVMLASLLAVAMTFVGCSKPAEHADEHAGHGHAHAKPAPIPPSQRDPKRLWCEEHAVYEDECVICHPELKGKAKPVTARRLMCNEHGVPEDECGICHPELAAKLKPGQGVKVRLPDAASAAVVGVQTAPPKIGAISESVECYAEIAFNQNKLAQIVAPVGGIIQSVDADLGNTVEEKQVVARLWSASIADAVSKALLSHQTLDRERKLRAERVTSEKDLQEAEAAHRSACQQVRTLGFTERQIEAMVHKPPETVLMEVRAPFRGEIIERMAVRGAMVEAGKPMFTLADRSTMWATLNIEELALARVRVGQTVEVRVESLPKRVFAGKLTWISAEVDERSRMARARAELPNPDGLLRAKMFAQARILTRSAEKSLLLPLSAVQRIAGNTLVFVKLADDLFEARTITVGAKFDGQCEVLAGLKPQEQVVVVRGFTLKSQLLASRLGAGCADD